MRGRSTAYSRDIGRFVTWYGSKRTSARAQRRDLSVLLVVIGVKLVGDGIEGLST